MNVWICVDVISLLQLEYVTDAWVQETRLLLSIHCHFATCALKEVLSVQIVLYSKSKLRKSRTLQESKSNLISCFDYVFFILSS